MIVRDLDSRNGTFIDNLRVTSAVIRLGQVLRLGDVAFQVQSLQEEVEPSSEVETARSPLNGSGRVADLSQAQRRVLELLRGALTEKEIASQLQLSPSTVHKHIHAIYCAFEVHSRPELMLKLTQNRN